MSFSLQVRRLLEAGLRLAADGENLRCQAPKGILRAEYREKLKREKSAILRALADREKARAAWGETLKTVSRAWNGLADARGGPVSVDDPVEPDVERQIGEAIRTASVDRALSLIGQWRASWITHIKKMKRRPAVEARPLSSLPSEVRVRKEAFARRLGAEDLFRVVVDEDLEEAEHEVFRREFYARADRAFEESEGRLPHPNQSVRDMLAGAARPASTKILDPETLERRQWLQGLVRSGKIDNIEPFEFRPGVRVEDPRKMTEALLRDLERPDSARCRHGVAQRDLQALFDHLNDRIPPGERGPRDPLGDETAPPRGVPVGRNSVGGSHDHERGSHYAAARPESSSQDSAHATGRSAPASKGRSRETRSRGKVERLKKEVALYSSELDERLRERGDEAPEVTIDHEEIDRQLAHLPASRSRRETELERERAVLRAKLAKLCEEREGKPCEAVILGGTVEYQLVLALKE